MQLHLWDRSPEKRRLRLIVSSALIVGWVSGVAFWSLGVPTLKDMARGSLAYLLDDGEGAGGTGTGFVITAEGHVLTNAHVVEDCRSIGTEIGGEFQPLILLGTDDVNDVALLKLPSPTNHIANFRDEDVRLAEPIVVAGFPMQSTLSSSIHVTTGLVSNLAAMYDDASSFQITAPIQPGSSGSPVLDQAGGVVGVIFGGLDAATMLEEDADVPQNVNFAVRSSVVRSFLAAYDVAVNLTADQTERDTASIVSEAKLYTLALTCEE